MLFWFPLEWPFHFVECYLLITTYLHDVIVVCVSFNYKIKVKGRVVRKNMLLGLNTLLFMPVYKQEFIEEVSVSV